MRIKIWGAGGSTPAPLTAEAIEEKILRAILGMPRIDTQDPVAVRAYIKTLPQLLRGTAGGNTACVEIQAGEETIIIDAGSGMRRLGLELMQGPCGRGEGKLHIFVSHLHWDHIQGFPFFMPAFVPGNQFIFYSVHNLEQALTEQQRYQNFPVAIDPSQAEEEFERLRESQRQRFGHIPAMQARRKFVRLEVGQPFTIGPVTINTLRNHHPGDAYSFRFEDQHSTFVYASDAEYKDLDDRAVQERLEFFKAADALIFDAQYGLRESWESKVDYGHSSAMIGVDFARRARVKKLLLYHHEPTYSDSQLEEIQSTAIAYQAQDDTLPTCEVLVAYEGLSLDLAPAGAIDWQRSPGGEAAILTASRTFGEIGIENLTRQLVQLAEEEGPARSVLDLSQVERMTTASLKALVTFSREREKGPLVLANPSPAVEEVIKLAGYGDYFAVYPTVAEAITAVQARDALKLPGQKLNDQYQIIETLGQGNSGTVLKVIDLVSQREAALRVLSPTFGVETMDHFVSQIHHLINLEHPNIARIYDSDWTQDGNHTFIVEEFLVGQTLADRLKQDQEPLVTDEALDLALDLTLALEYAHSRGVVHGNLKPADIFLTEDGIKIGGFGLGRLEEGRNLLEAPMLFLNPSHLAPEQILGQPLDARSDLYALGLILYQLFAGRPPFKGSDREILLAHLEQEPRPLRELNPHLSPSIEHLVLKLLAKHPNDRYASAKQTRRISTSLIFTSGETGQPGHELLVGRGEQLAALQEAWLATKSGRGQLVFISGEAGIGKTSLARAAAARTGASVVLFGHCQEGDGSPYHPFAEALQAYVATVPPEISDHDTVQLMSYFRRLLPELSLVVPNLQDPPSLEPRQDQLRMVSGLTRFLKKAGQRRPWLLVLDDLQWIDENSIELLRYLGRHLPEMALLIIGTYRDTDVGPDHPLQAVLRDLGRSQAYRHLPLERLRLAEVGQMLRALWNPAMPEQLAEQIYRQTAGNPLYVAEVAKGLEDTGLVSEQDGQWQFPEVETIELPQSMYEAIEGRIHYLSADTRGVLSQAAVLGQTFRFDDLVAMSGLSEWAVLEHLDLSLERQLVQEISGDEALRFSHPEIQHVLYSDLGVLRRRRLHRRAGDIIEKRAQPETDRVIEDLAHHFSEAGEIERALAYSIRAADQARAAYANEAALAWYERSLEMVERLSAATTVEPRAVQLSALESIGDVLALMGRYDDALAKYDAARQLLERDPQPTDPSIQRLADLYRRIADVYERRSDYTLALEWVEKGLSSLNLTQPTIEAVRLYNLEATIFRRQGKFDSAIACCQRSLVIASQIKTPGGQRAMGRTYYLLADCSWRLADFEQALYFSQQSVQIYQQLRDMVGLSEAHKILSNIYADRGDWTRAGDTLERSLTLKQAIGDVFGQASIANNLAYLHLDRGEWDKAAALYNESLNIWQQLGSAWGEAVALSNLAEVYMYQARWTEARTFLERSEALFSEINSEEYLPELERRWGEFYLGTGELDHALWHIRRSIDLAGAQEARLEEGMSYRILGQIHIALGEEEQAMVALAQSIQILSDLDSGYELARTRLKMAGLLLAAGRGDEAREHLAGALERFEQLGAAADLREARQLAQQLNLMGELPPNNG